MTPLLDALALGISFAGLLVVVVASARGHWRDGLKMALTFWTAAGLLRLAGGLSWGRIAASAAILVARQLVSFGLRHGALAPRPAAPAV